MIGRWAQRFATAMERPLLAYLVVCAAVGAAAAANAMAQLFMDRPPRYLTFFPAILFATLVAGGRGGVVATLASVIIAWTLWLPGDRSAAFWFDQHVLLVMYAASALATVAIAKALRAGILRGVDAEARFRAAQEGALDPFVIVDPIRDGGEIVDFRWSYANPAADKTAPSGVASLVGRRVLEVFPDQTGRDLVARFKAVLNGDGPDDLHVRRVIDGRERWMSSSGVRLGEGLAFTYRDVTDQRAAEDAMREAEASVRRSRDEFENIANAAPVMIWITDRDGASTWMNSRWLEFAGRPMAAELGTGWIERLHPDDRARREANLATAKRDLQPTSIECRMRRADGTYRWLEGAATPRWSSTGEHVGYIGSAVDVTERREAEAAFRQGAFRMQALLESLPQLLWSNRPDGSCDYLSPQWERFTGRPAAEHYGDGWLDVVHPEDHDHVRHAWSQTVAGRLPFDVEYRLRRHDGAWRWFNGRASAIRDEAGELQRWFGASTDITEIVEARRSLEERVAERTRELEASLEERARTEAALAQSQRLETVGRLTGGVAHDFNNLLTVVIGALDMVLRSPEDTPRVKRLTEAALAAGRRGERLTRQLLAFSRRQELKLEVVSVRDLIEEVEPLIRRAVAEAIDLAVVCDPAVGASRLDSAQFESALLNLVVNAADATGAGGRIEVRAARVVLAAGEVAGTAPGPHVRLAVSDTGAGMAPEVLQRVFEPFFTTKEVGKGSGLGLAQVYGFVSQCGGAVTVDSTVGQGTTVALYLPSDEGAPMASAAAASSPEALAALGAKVLLVEDDEAVRAVTQGLLTELGCEVTSAADGAAALRRLERGECFDLMISDIVMPGGLSGVDLARSARIVRPEMPVVLTTGYAGVHAGEAPADLDWPVLRKPFHRDQLAAVLGEHLGRASETTA